MALYDDPKKKKPEYAPGLLPGAQLIPGTMAAKVADAVGGFKANYQATQDRTGEYMRQQAAIARPDFGNVQGGIKTLQAPIVPRPQAQAQVSTQSPASTPTGAGASSVAGGAAPRSDGVTVGTGKFGERTFTATGQSVANAAIANPAGTIGSVNQQNFGNPVVPQAPGSIARPGVASTFGLGVNDPRMNDAIARPQVQLGPNQTNGFGTLRGPDQMAEQYNSREDRESRKQADGAIDTALFMARGKPGAEAAIANLLETKARLNSGAEGLSQEAIQNRANRDNQFGIADLNNAGENNRAGIQADVERGNQQVTREGQQLDYGAKLADIARPQLKQDANGNYVNIAGNTGTPVVDAAGNPVRGQQTQAETGQITPALQLAAINNELKSLAANPPMTDDPAYTQRIQSLRSQQEALLSVGASQASAPQGMKQIGTSGGKPVYEDAQGNRFIP